MLFSATKRSDYLKTLTTTDYDLLIIGGGITGAGIALDASLRGLRVALVEKHDFAWGTSSRSTKLIHGGLRYLKQLELGIVREVGLERAVVHRNARHLVVPERMLLPIVKGGSLGKFSTSVALWVYDFLANVRSREKRQMLDKTATYAAEPLLKTEELLGGAIYYEYRTDDARLTTEIIKSAVATQRATCLNYIEVTNFSFEKGIVNGVFATDILSNQALRISAKVIVNAAGPWVDNLRKMANDDTLQRKKLHLTKGVHLVVDYEKIPLKQAVYFDTPTGDNRMIFAIPRGNFVYIGTTDTDYYENIDTPKVSADDIAYILKAVNALFPSILLRESDIRGTWAGLRPLIHEIGKKTSELSRKDEIFYSKTGLITIAGGKLTGYRKMAQRIMDFVSEKLAVEHYYSVQPCQTKDYILSGAAFKNSEAINSFKVRRIGEAKQAGISANQIV
ncbi:MAG: glycerol-3-phosphate dehydrogenase, partial [Bacteroidota bacterium]